MHVCKVHRRESKDAYECEWTDVSVRVCENRYVHMNVTETFSIRTKEFWYASET